MKFGILFLFQNCVYYYRKLTQCPIVENAWRLFTGLSILQGCVKVGPHSQLSKIFRIQILKMEEIFQKQ